MAEQVLTVVLFCFFNQLLPFKCESHSATRKWKNKLIVAYDTKYVCFSLSTRVEWNIERLIWIGFKKNEANKKCLIQLLAKDIVKKIIRMIGCSNESFVSSFGT